MQKPEECVPNGDRYLAIEIEIDDFTLTAEGKRIHMPNANEMQRGWTPMRIVAVGGVNRGLPLPEAHLLDKNEWVPMFFQAGDVVAVEKYAAEKMFRIKGRKYAIIEQLDILLKFPVT